MSSRSQILVLTILPWYNVKVTQEVVSYHSQAGEEEVEEIFEEGIPQFEHHEDIAT